MKVTAIIIARGGSKGIPRKNIIDFCGKPLIAWTIEHCVSARGVDSVWVSSDSDEILAISSRYGASPIRRPDDLATDTATSEASWRHALDFIEETHGPHDLVIAPQVTSPLREPTDIERGISAFADGNFDSLFSCSKADDLYFWHYLPNGQPESINYDWRNRKRRQDHATQYIENGSFYMFVPSVLRRFSNRFGERIGMVEMDFWKTFEIDSRESLELCTVLMDAFLLKKRN